MTVWFPSWNDLESFEHRVDLIFYSAVVWNATISCIGRYGVGVYVLAGVGVLG